METASLIISVLLIVATAAVVLLPILRANRRVSAKTIELQRQRDALLVYYQQVTSTLRDLDDDAQAGKLDMAAYEEERERWMQRGVHVLEAIEQFEQRTGPVTHGQKNVSVDSVEDIIEDAVERYLKQHPAAEGAVQERS